MLTFAIVFVSFNLFRFIQTRSCFGINGWVCCDGYLLNQTTGQCQKCPLGYYLKNCLTKCSAPTYGEECQSTCQCPDVYCHFATGCPKHVYTSTGYQTQDTARQTTYSLTNTASNNDNDVTKMRYLPTEIDVTKNDLFKHVVKIIGSFLGLLVIVLIILFIYYLYLKCVDKTTNESGINEH
ncbi:uncharacterized protein LOC128174436 [Crassostrea angulata]|uniref:uncharacterized protein LOC128174436 n=1 Tax=Magallana angulata TaxID=2784310 RepID=UPI0022B14F51|nr:uncharacterized protein LOC128174436 [Crassostrea angulata]